MRIFPHDKRENQFKREVEIIKEKLLKEKGNITKIQADRMGSLEAEVEKYREEKTTPTSMSNLFYAKWLCYTYALQGISWLW